MVERDYLMAEAERLAGNPEEIAQLLAGFGELSLAFVTVRLKEVERENAKLKDEISYCHTKIDALRAELHETVDSQRKWARQVQAKLKEMERVVESAQSNENGVVQ